MSDKRSACHFECRVFKVFIYFCGFISSKKKIKKDKILWNKILSLVGSQKFIYLIYIALWYSSSENNFINLESWVTHITAVECLNHICIMIRLISSKNTIFVTIIPFLSPHGWALSHCFLSWCKLISANIRTFNCKQLFKHTVLERDDWWSCNTLLSALEKFIFDSSSMPSSIFDDLNLAVIFQLTSIKLISVDTFANDRALLEIFLKMIFSLCVTC